MSGRESSNLPPLETITAGDHGGYVVVAIYVTLVVTILFFAVRVIGRFQVSKPNADDWLLTMGMVFAITQSICMQLAVNAGLGKRDLVLDSSDLYRMAKGCAKASINFLFHSLKPFRIFVVASFAVLALTAAWTFASLMAIAFECDLPNPWLFEARRCLDLRALYSGIDAVNIFSETLIILLPVGLMPKLQTNWSVRLLVIGCFAARAVVIATLVGHITTLAKLSDYQELSWAYITPSIWMQCTMNMSLLTASIPGMQKILAQMRPGMTALTIHGSQSLQRSGPSRPSKPSALALVDSHRAGTSSFRGDRELWDMSRMEVSVETGSVRRMNSQEIMVTKELSQVVSS